MWNAIARSQTSGLMRSEDSLKTRGNACLEHECRDQHYCHAREALHSVG